MYPALFKIGSLTIYSYGVMVAIAFLVGRLILKSELRGKGLNTGLADSFLMAAIIGGLLGAKIFYIIDNFKVFLYEPWSIVFSGGGLVWYGGFLGGLVAVTHTIKRRKFNWLQIADCMSPALALGYAIGRIGCLLSGDGDYGKPTNLPWAMSFPNGTVPTTELVHPTPIYETLIMFVVFLILLRLGRRNLSTGRVFWIYLILAGTERFIIEFWRINPIVALGLTMAQFISIVVIVFGITGLLIGGLKNEDVRRIQNS